MIKNTMKSTGCNFAKDEKAANVNMVQRVWFPLIGSELDIVETTERADNI